MIQLQGSLARGLAVGDRATYSRTFTEADLALFGSLTGDLNPYHYDAEFAKTTRFGKVIVHGLLVGAMATHIGGQWAFLASSIGFEFLGPVYVGDTVTMEAQVESKDERGRCTVAVRGKNQRGEEVVKGSFVGLAPREKELKALTRGA